MQYLTTADGLSNNSVRYIHQDSKGFIWMSSLNGLNRYDGNSFRTFLPKNNGQMSLADRRVKHLYEDANGFLWISTSADRFSCYDLKRDCFVDFTGCGEHEDHYGYITVLPDAVWLWGRGQGCRLIQYRDGKFASKVLIRKTGSFNRIMSSLCYRTVPGGYGSVRIRDFIVGKIMRCSVSISHTVSSVPVALKARLVL